MSRFKTTISLLGAGAMALALTACGDDDSASGGSADYCDLLDQNAETLSGVDADPEDPEAVAAFSTAMHDIAEAAPSDIQGDWQTLADFFTALSEVDLSDPEAATEQMAQIEGFDEVDAISERLAENVQAECDMELPGL